MSAFLKKRFTLKRPTADRDNEASTADTPEANAARGVRLFAESAAANTGEEVLHLPTIVESAVASPAAAKAAAAQIRAFLSKENTGRPHVQYNAVMLIRILADNPGPSFTKHLDKGFADTVKHLLRYGRDPSVAQILKETLDALDRDKKHDTNLTALFAMWKKEKTLMANASKSLGPRTMNAPAWNGQAPRGGFTSSSTRTLPPPAELVGRIEEARTSAKLLLQLVQSTPANELMANDLVKEFSERCMSAQRSIQGYINCDNPSPDDDTMLTLIETNEQLSLAASKHQRAMLQARRLLGPTPSPPIPQTNGNSNGPAPATVPAPGSTYGPPAQPPPREQPALLPPLDVASRDQRGPSNANDQDELHMPASLQAGDQGRRKRSEAEEDDPFADHHMSPYVPPPGPPPQARATGHGGDNPDRNAATGSPTSYNPGYHSTPSYLGRQESSANNLTMHGAAPPALTEEDEYARDYPAQASQATPERTSHVRQTSDVSPVAERTPVTYRY